MSRSDAKPVNHLRHEDHLERYAQGSPVSNNQMTVSSVLDPIALHQGGSPEAPVSNETAPSFQNTPLSSAKKSGKSKQHDMVDGFNALPAINFVRNAYLDLCGLAPMSATLILAFFPFLFLASASQRIKISMDNIALIFPHLTKQQRRWMAWQAFFNFAQTSIEFFTISSKNPAAVAQIVKIVEGASHLEEALKSGRPLIFALSHGGSFGASIAVMRAILQRDVQVFIHDTAYSSFNNIKEFYGRKNGDCTTTNNTGGSGRIIRQLRSGMPLVLMVDGYNPHEGIKDSWLGIPTKVVTGHLRIASMVGGTIVPTFVDRTTPYGFEVGFSAPINVDKGSLSNENQGTIIRAVLSVLEQWVLERPWNWSWLHRRWRHPI